VLSLEKASLPRTTTSQVPKEEITKLSLRLVQLVPFCSSSGRGGNERIEESHPVLLLGLAKWTTSNNTGKVCLCLVLLSLGTKLSLDKYQNISRVLEDKRRKTCRLVRLSRIDTEIYTYLQSVGLLLLIVYFVIDEDLGDFEIPYLVYIGLLVPLGVIILLSVYKEIDWLIRGVTWLFILTQIFGFGVRILVPAQTTSWTILQRIAALFTGILSSAIYSAILILFARKLRKAKKAAALAAADAAAAAEEEMMGGDGEGDDGDDVDGIAPGPSRGGSAIEQDRRNVVDS
ncbi:hypothetical protein Fcan01_09285, partial [Folsomia candida]